MFTRLSTEQYEQASEQYIAGASLEAVCANFHVGKRRLRKLLEAMGTPIRPKGWDGPAHRLRYEGRRRRTDRGYVRVYMDGRWPLEHRALMEQALGRTLEPNEVVHHKNGIRDDNRLVNLEVKDRLQHMSEHMKGHVMGPHVKSPAEIEKHRAKLIGRWIFRPDVTEASVHELYRSGLSLNQIAIQLNCSWGVVKTRLRGVTR